MSTETTSQPTSPTAPPPHETVVSGAAEVSAAPASGPAASPSGAAPAVTKRMQGQAACPACGKANTLDSKFCRYCGIGLALVTVPIPVDGAAATGTPGAGARPQNGSAPGHKPASDSNQPAASQPAASEPAAPEGEGMDPAEIDARRARQLLDRALVLSDKGDKAGAILACRQAIGLAPGIAAGYAMLGPLLERSGDPRGAMGAYEKVLSLQPSSPIERDSLARLRAAARHAGASRTAGLFHFDAGELFNETGAPAAAPVAAIPAPATPADPAPVAATPAVAAATAATALPVTPPAPAAPAYSVPPIPAGTLAPRPAAPRSTQFTVPPISASPAPVASPLSFPAIHDDTPVVIPRWVRTLRGERSFWMQSVPLSVLAVLSLGFLLWARNTAASRVEVPLASPAGQQPAGEAGNDVPPPAAAQPTSTQSNPAVTNPANSTTTANGVAGEPITNGSQAHGNPPPVPAAPRIAAAPPSEQAPRSTGGDRAPAPRATPAPPPETPTIPPFAMPRPPRVEPATAPEPPIKAVPFTTGNSGGSTSGGAPVNPAGAPKTGYVKITSRPASSVPARPESRSRAAEAAAAEAARAGRTGGAIASASASIEGGRETGWRYQQRALLFLEQGDNNRAADDFRTAIAAYRDQINRGTNTEQARSGISACQDGLRLAQLRLR